MERTWMGHLDEGQKWSCRGQLDLEAGNAKSDGGEINPLGIGTLSMLLSFLDLNRGAVYVGAEKKVKAFLNQSTSQAPP